MLLPHHSGIPLRPYRDLGVTAEAGSEDKVEAGRKLDDEWETSTKGGGVLFE